MPARLVTALTAEHNEADHIHTGHHGDIVPKWGYFANKTATKPTTLNWEDPSSWVDGVLPAEGDNVQIPGGLHVTLSSDTPRLYAISVGPGASLTVKPKPQSTVRVTANTLFVDVGGSLTIDGGTGEVDVTFIDAVYHEKDVKKLGMGLVCLGDLRVIGRTVDPFTPLAEPAHETQHFIDVYGDYLEGWESGREIQVIPCGDEQQYYHDMPKPTRCTVGDTAIHLESRTFIGLKRQLGTSHTSRAIADDGQKLLPDVVLTWRSVRFHGRGHIWVGDTGKCDIRYAGMYGLGRGDEVGRYPIHLHGSNPPEPWDDPQHGKLHNILIGNYIEDSEYQTDYGLVVHGTHWSLVKDNAVMCGRLAAVLFEDGSESWNQVYSNLACPSSKSAAGFKIYGIRNWFVENTACCAGTGFYFPMVNNSLVFHIPTEPGNYDFTLPEARLTIGYSPLSEWSGQKSYNVEAGEYWNHRRGGAGSVPVGFLVARSTYFETWSPDGGGQAVAIYDTDGITMVGCRLFHSEIGNYSNVSTNVEDCVITGGKRGFNDRSSGGRATLKRCTISCETAVAVVKSSNVGNVLPPAGQDLKRLRIEDCNLRGSVTEIAMSWKWDRNTNTRVPCQREAVEIWNGGVKTADVYFHEQESSVVVVANDDIPYNPNSARDGAPERGLTNAECWAKWRKCNSGAVAPPHARTEDKIFGLIACKSEEASR
jgi:hypothetical protein